MHSKIERRFLRGFLVDILRGHPTQISAVYALPKISVPEAFATAG
jgi:hypothetical protein